MRPVAIAVDRVLEATIVGSFTKLGSGARRRLEGWGPALTEGSLQGRTIVLTGATSGLGEAAAEAMVDAGARLVIVGRNRDRTGAARAALAARAGDDDRVLAVVADMGELDQVRAAGAQILDDSPEVDTLVHNAGSLTGEHDVTSDGIEATVASQVIGPFLLTSLLRAQLSANAPARVVTMTSGGMYGAQVTVDDLEMDPDTYGGSDQYARAKRAQVTLNEMWPEEARGEGIAFHVTHPGWADTPGVSSSLPRFKQIMGPLLRTPADGVDTLLWLVGGEGSAAVPSGRLWLDRSMRPIHRLPSTRRSDTPVRRRELWDHVTRLAGLA